MAIFVIKKKKLVFCFILSKQKHYQTTHNTKHLKQFSSICPIKTFF